MSYFSTGVKIRIHLLFLFFLSLYYLVPYLILGQLTLDPNDILDNEIVYNSIIGKILRGDFDSIDNDTTAQVGIHLNTDYSNDANAWTHVANAATGTKNASRQTAACEIIIDVESTANDKVKFASSSLAGDILGNTAVNLTTFTFIRLGAT